MGNTCRVTCLSVWHKGLRVGGKRNGDKLVDGTVVESAKKIIKLAKLSTEKKVETTIA